MITVPHLLLLLLLAASAALATPPANCSYTSDVLACVDPYISTGGFGFGVGGDPVGAQIPFGNLRLSPDSVYDGDIWLEFQHFGGYNYNDSWIRCFSHTHMVGSGVPDYGNFGIMPVRQVEHSIIDNQHFHSQFSHNNETVQAGYYAVHLQTPATYAELTACDSHAGYHRYTFEPQASANGSIILFAMSHTLNPPAGKGANASITYDSATGITTVSGWVRNAGDLTGRNNGRGIDMFLVAEIKSGFQSFGVWGADENPQWGVNRINGSVAGAFVKLPPSVTQVEVAVAISYVSLAQAQRNLQVQVGNQTFDQCRQKTQNFWRQQLSAVQVASPADPDDLTMFYTALYHSLMAPSIFSEADGAYLGMGNLNVYTQPPGRVRYSDMSIWDIFRSQVPLLMLLQPNVAQDIAQSLVQMYVEGGDIPRWPIANVYSGCMIGTHGNIIMAELIAKGLTNFDISTAYQGMYQEATNATRPHISRGGLQDYITLGYVTSEDSDTSASLTLSYAYDDWALSTIAAYLGYNGDQAMFFNRSKNYRNVFNPENQYMCARSKTGAFQCQENPAWTGWMLGEMRGFTEGNAEQWRWFVPHDLEGLIDLFGSPENYAAKLNTFFNNTGKYNRTDLPNPYYWAGNEPDILEPFQFNVAGRADLTQKWSRAVIKQSYDTAPHGVPGNDDYGALSSWLVFAMLGFYPLAGTNRYFLGSPTFQEVKLNLPGDATLLVKAYNATHENIYVQKAAINSAAINMTIAEITHNQIMTQGKTALLEFWMGPDPVRYY